MLKEKYFVFIFLLGVGLNVLVLACLILMGQRADARAMWSSHRGITHGYWENLLGWALILPGRRHLHRRGCHRSDRRRGAAWAATCRSRSVIEFQSPRMQFWDHFASARQHT